MFPILQHLSHNTYHLCLSQLCLALSVFLVSCGNTEFLGSEEPRRDQQKTQYREENREEKTTEEEKQEKEPSSEQVPEEALAEEESQEEPPTTPVAPAPTVVEESTNTEITTTEQTVEIEVEVEVEEPEEPEVKTKIITQTFSTAFDTIEKPVDVLLIIDNSYSMRHEIKQVRDNLTRFINHISSYTKTKVGVLSQFDPGKDERRSPLSHVQLPASSSSSVMKINRRVQSYNSLVLAYDYIKDVLRDNSGKRVTGSDFFRDEALKVFVVVSDEDSRDYGAKAFARDLSKLLDLETVRLFGFVGIPSAAKQNKDKFVKVAPQSVSENCVEDILMKGEIYYDLVKNYIKGALFDICEQDWSSHFDFMVRSVVQSVKPQYTLEYSADSISSVSINGQTVNKENYEVEDNKITFKSNILPQEKEVAIQVVYTSNSK